ncbi:error-prone DNA polymerase [Leucobacter massiliensis]|uniref:Error-prone DNA polymerase n=1 Tax=Leucobacter massiliensis TaxID=1686285 RepID=A0A2S9QMU6_9MICO|nr:error-prone DNA polymerase [Leucobacter massiliensis]PRI10900.1 error-prone DNA polymerase [Leucobacter massiliensis]
MKWSNSPLPWHEFERRLSLRGPGPEPTPAPPAGTGPESGPAAAADAVRGPVSAPTPVPVPAPGTVPRAPAAGPVAEADAEAEVPYAELHAHSHYSFLDGASSPEQLVAEAARLGLDGLALTDHDGLYGAALFAEAAEAQARAAAESGGKPLLTVYGAELSLGLDAPQLGAADPAGAHLLVLARGTQGYHRLAGAITEAQLAGGEKGRPVYTLEELAEAAAGEWVILTGCRKGSVRRALEAAGASHPAPSNRADAETAARAELDRLAALFGEDNVYVELSHQGHPGDDSRNARLAALAADRGLPALVTGNVHYASRAQAPLAEAMSAVRARRSLDELDPYLAATGSAHLRSGAAVLRRFRDYPDAVARTVPLARELAFPLKAARPRLPRLDIPSGITQMEWLRRLVWEGAERRYGSPLPESSRARLERELGVIAEKDFPGYFLIVHDLVREARERGILCQGRGSAANSAVCFVLGITAVDSIFYDLPFERFLSSMRDEEPDIDVDFDSERREEIIQYVYERYGRRNAAQVANVISYRPKAAIRDAAKALGFGAGQQRAWTKSVERWSGIEEDPESPIPLPVQRLAGRFLTAPRHLGIHSGGMVLTERPVGEVCPIEHARMDGRTVLQWDKDSCAAMGLVKFDMLGLGMLSALQKTMDLVAAGTGERWTFETIPREEPGVYDMLCRADAVGVFQVESRAQLNTLPRLKPRRFYDLVIEIALIRPGPIQGGAVHPYLRRRSGQEPVTYPHPRLAPVLERTLGVPIFQEQLMQMATAIGGCSAEDADLLRRSMGSKRGQERIDSLQAKLFAGMRRNGISDEDAARLYEQIRSFADFGFAESHSLSFALLVYMSSWFKLHYPAAFLAGLLRSQPMGFYSPRELVQDARRHGVEVLPPDVQRSEAHAALEPFHPAATQPTGPDSCLAREQPPVGPFAEGTRDTSATHRRDGAFATRLGLTAVRGIETAAAERIVRARERGPFESLADLARRADLDRTRIEALAASGACESLGIGRREALWSAAPAADNRERFLPGIAVHIQPPLLPVLDPAEQTALDLWSTGIPLTAHPLALLRDTLDARGVVRSDHVARARPGTVVEVAGLVTHRQRPGTAGGIVFVTLEDEAGSVNVVTWRDVWLRNRLVARSAPALLVRGMLERSPEGIVNVIAESFEPLAAPAGTASRDFR